MKPSNKFFMFLILVIALLAFYHSLFPLPATVILNRFLALSGFFLLCMSLLIGPLVVLRPKEFASLIRTRAIVGIASFILVAAHFVISLFVMYQGDLGIITDSRVAIAVPALAIMLLLALLSNEWAIKKLGIIAWKNIQRLAYLAFALSLIHYILEAKGLFVPVGSNIFVNLAEVFALLLAAATILLQISGAIVCSRRKNCGEECTEACENR